MVSIVRGLGGTRKDVGSSRITMDNVEPFRQRVPHDVPPVWEDGDEGRGRRTLAVLRYSLAKCSGDEVHQVNRIAIKACTRQRVIERIIQDGMKELALRKARLSRYRIRERIHINTPTN